MRYAADCAGKNMTVNGLSPGMAYTFYLAAGNAVGIGRAIKFRVRTPRRLSHNQQSGEFQLNSHARHKLLMELFITTIFERRKSRGEKWAIFNCQL